MIPVYDVDPDTYVGTHRYHVDPVLRTDPGEVTVAPLGADDRWEIGAEYEPRHYAEVSE